MVADNYYCSSDFVHHIILEGSVQMTEEKPARITFFGKNDINFTVICLSKFEYPNLEITYHTDRKNIQQLFQIQNWTRFLGNKIKYKDKKYFITDIIQEFNPFEFKIKAIDFDYYKFKNTAEKSLITRKGLIVLIIIFVTLYIGLFLRVVLCK